MKRIATHKHNGEDGEAAQDPQLEEESRNCEVVKVVKAFSLESFVMTTRLVQPSRVALLRP